MSDESIDPFMDIEEKKKEKKPGRPRGSFFHYAMGTLYFVSSVLIAKLAGSQTTQEYAARAVEAVRERPLSQMPISQRLNLEGVMADNADNLVRITTSYGVGTGQLTDPYTVFTANHVVNDAVSNKSPIYIQSQTFLRPGESIKVDLTPQNFRGSDHSDLAMITLTRPVYGAKQVAINRSYDFKQDDRVGAVCYRDRQIVTQVGHVEAISAAAPRFLITDIQGGPGNSGCAMFNARGEMVGVTSMAAIAPKELYTNMDSGNLIFTDIGNPL